MYCLWCCSVCAYECWYYIAFIHHEGRQYEKNTQNISFITASYRPWYLILHLFFIAIYVIYVTFVVLFCSFVLPCSLLFFSFSFMCYVPCCLN